MIIRNYDSTGESRTNSIGLTELAWDYTTTGYVYDGAYNPTKLRNVATTLGYNANNQLTGTGYGYDGEGNPTLYASGTLDYNETNRLSSLTISGGASPAYRAGYRGDGLRAWRVSSTGTVTYFVYDDAGGTLQYEMEGSGAVYPITNAYGFGAAGLAQRVQPTVSNRVTSFGYDPSGNTITRSLSSGNAALPSGYPVEVALYDGYGYPKADISANIAGSYFSGTGPTSYTAGYSVGFGGQFGYYVENNTKLASSDPRDRGLILCMNRYYDPINARWLTRDPIGYDGDMNLYGYVQGNPVMRSDPDGLDWVDDHANFWAGAGDSLTFGLTGLARNGLDTIGFDSDVDESSGAYIGGMYTEMAIEIAVSGGAKIAAKRAATAIAQRVAARGVTAAAAKKAIQDSLRSQARRVLSRKGVAVAGKEVDHLHPLLGHSGEAIQTIRNRGPLSALLVRGTDAIHTVLPTLGFPTLANLSGNLKALDHTAHMARHVRTIQFEMAAKLMVNRFTLPIRAARNASTHFRKR